jgi:hypothetical protein
VLEPLLALGARPIPTNLDSLSDFPPLGKGAEVLLFGPRFSLGFSFFGNLGKICVLG